MGMTSLPEMTAGIYRPLIYATGLAVLWAVLAFLSSETTYHLAPLLVAGVPPTFEGTQTADLAITELARHAVLGLSLALLTTLVLSLVGALAGPSLLPRGGAAYESVVFAIVGALSGLAVGVWMTRRQNR